MNRLILFQWPPIYLLPIHGGLVFNNSEAILVMETFNIKGNLEDYYIPVKRRVCGKTWKEIL